MIDVNAPICRKVIVGKRCPVRFRDQLCGASGRSAEVDADVEVEVLG